MLVEVCGVKVNKKTENQEIHLLKFISFDNLSIRLLKIKIKIHPWMFINTSDNNVIFRVVTFNKI